MTGHTQGCSLGGREAEAAVVGRIADENDRTVTLPARHAERAADQRRANSAVAAIGGDGDRAKQQSRLTGAADNVPKPGRADDALAIKAYLFSLKPIKYTPPPNDVAFPFNQRYLMIFWNVLFKPAHRFQPNIDQSVEWNRGAYLTEALGHCGDCHTPRNILFGLKSRQKFAGELIQGWKAYNITPDRKWGIGEWSEAQVQSYLAHGHADGRSSASGPMAEVVDNSLRFLTQDDIGAMAAYLRSVPSRAARGQLAVAQPPAGQLQPPKDVRADSGGGALGLRIFEGACIGCHSFDGGGAVSKYATLLGTRAVNDPAGTNATQALLQGTHVNGALGKEFMPGFGNGYSDAEIAAVVNFVTGRFGLTASALTPEEIAKRRQEDLRPLRSALTEKSGSR